MDQRYFLERKRLSLDGNKVLVKLVAPLLIGWASQGHSLPFMGSQLSPFVKWEHWISKASLTPVFLDFAMSQTLLWKKQEKVQLRFVVKEARLILASVCEAYNVRWNYTANKYWMLSILLRKEKGRDKKSDTEKLDENDRWCEKSRERLKIRERRRMRGREIKSVWDVEWEGGRRNTKDRTGSCGNEGLDWRGWGR